METKLPIGFRFVPTEEELINDYLKKKVAGEVPPSSVVGDAEVYKVEPWRLPGVTDEGGVDGETKHYYFFTRRKRKHKTGNRTDRSAGDGFWKVTCGDKEILDSQKKPIGMKKCLVFNCARGKLERKFKNKKWIMHEYRLSSEKVGGWVLCRIKKSNNRSVAKDEEGDDNESTSTTNNPVGEIQEPCNGSSSFGEKEFECDSDRFLPMSTDLYDAGPSDHFYEPI